MNAQQSPSIPPLSSAASSSPHYQMWWDCGACGATGLLGHAHRHCPQCGAAQDPQQRYFPPAGAEVEVKAHRYVGVDWRCRFCESPNAASADFCGNCGGPKEDATQVPLVEDKPATPTTPPQAARRTGWGTYALVVVALLGLVMAYFAMRTHPEQAVIADKNWTREVEIERLTAVSQTRWCDALPADAYQISRVRVQRSTRSTPDGQECHDVRVDAGDGTFTKRKECTPRYREEPIYDDQCRYRVNRWQVQRSDQLQGLTHQPPAWPQPSLAPGLMGGGGLGAERLGQRHETYRVVLKATQTNKTWTCQVSPRVWSQLRLEQRVALQVRGTGGADCTSLLAADL